MRIRDLIMNREKITYGQLLKTWTWIERNSSFDCISRKEEYREVGLTMFMSGKLSSKLKRYMKNHSKEYANIIYYDDEEDFQVLTIKIDSYLYTILLYTQFDIIYNNCNGEI